MPLPPGKTHYTYADLKLTDEGERIEIIYGKPYFMKSASLAHQTVSGALLVHFANFLHGKAGEVLARPLGVRLFEKPGDAPEDVDTVVESDILVVCDKSKFDKYGCVGAPDLIVEILEPYTYYHDLFIKLDLYQRAGVREYWIADPDSRTFKVFTLDENGIYHVSRAYGQHDSINVGVGRLRYKA